MSTPSRASAPAAKTGPRRPVEPVYWFFLVPAVAVFTLMIAYPAVEGITMSFTNSMGFGGHNVSLVFAAVE